MTLGLGKCRLGVRRGGEGEGDGRCAGVYMMFDMWACVAAKSNKLRPHGGKGECFIPPTPGEP